MLLHYHGLRQGSEHIATPRGIFGTHVLMFPNSGTTLSNGNANEHLNMQVVAM
jgi:hypothetical protein